MEKTYLYLNLHLSKMFASMATSVFLAFFSFTVSNAQNLSKSNPADDFWIEIETPGEWYHHPVARTIDTVYAATQYGVVRSTDRCKTWESIGLVRNYIPVLYLTDNGELLAGNDPSCDGSILHKWDGTNWTNMNLDEYNPATSIIQTSDGSLLVGNRDGIYKSSNNGITWMKTYTTNSLSWVESFLDLENGVLLASFYRGDICNIGILRSTDYGNTWEHVGLNNTLNIILSKDSGGSVFAACRGNDNYYLDKGLYRSTDSGMTWEVVIDSLGLGGIAIDDNDVIYGCYNNNNNSYYEFYRTKVSEDYNLDDINCGLNAQLLRVSISDDGYLFAYDFDELAFKLFRSRESVYSYFSVELAVEPAEAGLASGAGTYLFGEHASLEAAPNSGYRFLCWTNQDGDTISTETYYRHLVARNNRITGHFEDIADVPEAPASEIKIWPNPVNDILNMEGLDDDSEITVSDVTGRIVYRQNHSCSSEIDLSRLNSGIYYLSIKNDSGKSVRMIVKQ